MPEVWHSRCLQERPLGSTTSQVVLGDRRADGKIKKHLVKIRTSEGNRYYICNFCSRFGFMWSCELNCVRSKIYILQRIQETE